MIRTLVFSVLGFEILCAFIILLLLIAAKIKIYFQDQKEKRFLNSFNHTIKNFLKEQIPLKEILELKITHPFLLLELLEDYDRRLNDGLWLELKNALCKRSLIPIARQYYQSKTWIKRSLSARIFLLAKESSESVRIIYLLEDTDYFIRYLAATALGELRNPLAIEPLIQAMAKETEECRFIYRSALAQMPLEGASTLLSLYMLSQDIEQRLCCLDALMYRFYGDIYPSLRRDLFIQNVEIRKRIAYMLGNHWTKESLKDLHSLMGDSNAQVRLQAVKGASKRLDPESFSPLCNALRDRDRSVSLEAAKGLFLWGERGIAILQRQDSDLFPHAHQAARQVLTLAGLQ